MEPPIPITVTITKEDADEIEDRITNLDELKAQAKKKAAKRDKGAQR